MLPQKSGKPCREATSRSLFAEELPGKRGQLFMKKVSMGYQNRPIKFFVMRHRVVTNFTYIIPKISDFELKKVLHL